MKNEINISWIGVVGDEDVQFFNWKPKNDSQFIFDVEFQIQWYSTGVCEQFRGTVISASFYDRRGALEVKRSSYGEPIVLEKFDAKLVLWEIEKRLASLVDFQPCNAIEALKSHFVWEEDFVDFNVD